MHGFIADGVVMVSRNKSTKLGFTLIEMSVVMVVISLLLAGIAVGGSLIQEAKIAGIISDFQNINTSYKTFNIRYNAIPGDMNNATSYWPTGVCAVVTADCNGNGNGIIDTQFESLASWRHLALAGMSDYTLDAFADSTSVMLVIGSDVPASRIKGSGYMMVSGDTNLIGTAGAIKSSLWNNGTNAVFIGTQLSTSAVFLNGGALTGAQAFNIDQKVDDGHISSTGAFLGADTGNVRTFEGSEVLDGTNIPNKCLSATAPFSYVVNSIYTSCGVGMALK